MIIQKIAREYDGALERAVTYYEILLSLNGIKLRNKELQLLAFTAVRGTITPLSAREEFIRLFNSSLHSIENMKGILVRRGLLVKDEDMYRVLPAIALDFTKPLALIIKLNGKESNGLSDQEDIQEAGDQ